jgi:hypothetical protein
VTALSVENGLIYSGQGTSLQIYDQTSHKLLASSKIFRSNIIHGVAIQNSTTSSDCLLIWGGRHIVVARLVQNTSQTNVSPGNVSINIEDRVTLPDWIFDVSFKPNDQAPSVDQSISRPECAVLVTAHNVLFKVDVSAPISSESQRQTLNLAIKQLQIGPRCILYSSHLKWSSPTELLVASGTAFGEIVAWSYVTGDRSGFSVRPYLTLTGHEGSVFGVRISDSVAIGLEGARQFLTSCSDDRTIRVWDISDLLFLPVSSVPQTEHQTTHETGFLSDLADNSPTAKDGRCVTVAMGHVSRIWRIRYSYPPASKKGSPNTTSFTILSVGEDATCQSWNFVYSLENSTENSLIHAQTREYHSGKNIWSVALVEGSETAKNFTVITGGADSGTVSASFATNESSEIRYMEQWDIGDLSTQLLQSTSLLMSESGSSDRQRSRKKNKYMLDCFRSYAFVKENTLLVTTNNGLVLTVTLVSSDHTQNSSWQWDYIDLLEDLKGYSVATSIADSTYAFLAGAKGTVYVFNLSDRQLSLLATVNGKVAGLFVQKSKPQSSTYASLLVAQLGDQSPQHICLQRSHAGELSACDMKPVAIDGLNSKAFTVTSYTSVSTNLAGGMIFLGYRDGTILCQCSDSGKMNIVISRAHGQEAVTGLHWVSEVVSSDTEGWLLSVGRDGTCAIHQFFADGSNPLLIHKLNLPFGPNIEGIYVNQSKTDLCVYGFHGKNFVVHSLSTSQDIMTVECGGAHRVWNFKPRLDMNQRVAGGAFAWTKASKLNACSFLKPSHTIIQNGGHGREIKACAVAPTSLRDTTIGPLIATGAEDTDIRIFSYSKNLRPGSNPTESLNCLAVLRKHVTGVQSVEWSSNGQYLFSCGGYEEFLVWKLQAAPCILVGVVCESSCPIQEAKSDLRIMDFAIRDEIQKDLDGDEKRNASFLVAMVYSNSVIKVLFHPFLSRINGW